MPGLLGAEERWDKSEPDTLRSERRGEGGRGEVRERGDGGGLNFLWKGWMEDGEGGDELDSYVLCLAGIAI